MNVLGPLYPEIALVVLALATLVFHALRPAVGARCIGHLLASAVLLVLVSTFALLPAPAPLFGGLYRLDALALFFKQVLLGSTALALVAAAEAAPRLAGRAVELFVLMLLAGTGMLALASAADLIMLFVALELVTVSFYAMTAFQPGRAPSVEAGTKYLIVGALSSGMLVYGLSYLFGTTGATRFDAIARVLAAGEAPAAGAVFAMLLMLGGLTFKLAAVPGHMWAPDVYQGAPTPVTAFLASGSKAAGVVVLIRLVTEVFHPLADVWQPLLVVLGGLSILYGAFGALGQTSVKRIYGYASISSAGFLLMGLCAGSQIGAAAVLFYVAQYAASALCGLLALDAAMAVTGSDDIRALAGLHRRAPMLAAALGLSVLSLAGIPPLPGFFAKFALFAAAIRAASTVPYLGWLVVAAALGAILGLYYYFRVIRALLADEPADASPIQPDLVLRLYLIVAMAALLVFGIWQASLFDPALAAVPALR